MVGSRRRRQAPSSLYPFGDDYEVTNGVITKYITVDGLGVIAKRVGTQTFWVHADRLGSIQAITDVTGTDIQRRTYRPYGEKIADTSAHAESRGYIGERQDEDTGLTYLHARYYDPALGVFISPDPLDPDDRVVGTNRYAYTFGDPVTAADRAASTVYSVASTVDRGYFWAERVPPALEAARLIARLFAAPNINYALERYLEEQRRRQADANKGMPGPGSGRAHTHLQLPGRPYAALTYTPPPPPPPKCEGKCPRDAAWGAQYRDQCGGCGWWRH